MSTHPLTPETAVADIGLSVRTSNMLDREGIATVAMLSTWTASELRAIRNFGKGSLAEVTAKGIPLAPEPTDTEAAATAALTRIRDLGYSDIGKTTTFNHHATTVTGELREINFDGEGVMVSLILEGTDVSDQLHESPKVQFLIHDPELAATVTDMTDIAGTEIDTSYFDDPDHLSVRIEANWEQQDRDSELAATDSGSTGIGTEAAAMTQLTTSEPTTAHTHNSALNESALLHRAQVIAETIAFYLDHNLPDAATLELQWAHRRLDYLIYDTTGAVLDTVDTEDHDHDRAIRTLLTRLADPNLPDGFITTIGFTPTGRQSSPEVYTATLDNLLNRSNHFLTTTPTPSTDDSVEIADFRRRGCHQAPVVRRFGRPDSWR